MKLALHCVACGDPFIAVKNGRGRNPSMCSPECRRVRRQAQCESYQVDGRYADRKRRGGRRAGAGRKPQHIATDQSKADVKRMLDGGKTLREIAEFLGLKSTHALRRCYRQELLEAGHSRLYESHGKCDYKCGRGGRRPGAGRPPGGIPKLDVKLLALVAMKIIPMEVLQKYGISLRKPGTP